ncbi:MCP four helix bundle domain-containing protein [Vibrio navarrensis]|uniref:MCP four helix bundle domain-containing protein n=1 Tax=Vibrio navarrensis TaxID=29495 RepID=UPI0018DD1282|nr:MCP four helix bundle domain-containing protein [Vibrio navarrensis]
MIRNIKIASRTIISFGFLSCICLLLGLYSIAQLSKLNDTTDVLTLQRMPAIVAAEKMRRMVLLSQISVTELSDAKSIEQQQNIKNTINALTREYDKNEADLNLLIKSQTAQAIFRDVRESHDKFIASLPRLFELTRNGEIDASLVYRDSTVKQNSLELRKLLDQLVDFQQSEAIRLKATTPPPKVTKVHAYL